MTTDLPAKCLYCGGTYEPRPLPFDCPACGMALGKTLTAATTLADLASIAVRSGKRVSVGAAYIAPGVAGIVIDVDGGGSWGDFMRADGAPLTAEDEAAIDSALTTPTPPTET